MDGDDRDAAASGSPSRAKLLRSTLAFEGIARLRIAKLRHQASIEDVDYRSPRVVSTPGQLVSAALAKSLAGLRRALDLREHICLFRRS
jgi:hypothetical protein